MTYNIRDYSESDESHDKRSTPEYEKAARKYETLLNTTSASLDNFLNKTPVKVTSMQGQRYLRNLVAAKLPLARNITPQGGFVCTP